MQIANSTEIALHPTPADAIANTNTVTNSSNATRVEMEARIRW